MSFRSKKIGQEGENVAAEHLKSKGYEILERNFRCPLGEIDIVAKDKDDIVFVEVKTKSGNLLGTPEEMVNKRKQKKLIKLGQFYLQEKELNDCPWRIDVVAIIKDAYGGLDIQVFKNTVEEI